MRTLLFFLLLTGCTAALTTELPVSSLERLNQLEKKPEVYLKGASGNFLVTNNTKVELFLRDNRTILVYASEIFVEGDRLLLRGRDQEILLVDISKIKLTDRY